MIVKNNDFLYDNRVRKEAATLAGAGHQVVVLAKKTSRSESHEIDGEVEVIRIPSLFWDPRRLFLEKAVDIDADVYHAHDLYALDIGVVAARRTGAFCIYDSHELWTALLKQYWGIRYLRRLFYWMRERFLIRESDVVITVSDSIAELLRKKYRLGYVEVVRNVPLLKENSSTKDLRQFLSIARDQKIIVHIGGITKARGIQHVIEAMKLNEHLVLVCIGAGFIDDPYLMKLKTLASEAGVSDRVHFLPYMKLDEMIAYTSSGDIGLCTILPTTRSYRLSLPNKLFDYFLAGLPVVASDIPEIAALVRKYDVGITVSPNDSVALSQALKELVDDSSTYLRMKQNTARALEENNWAIESRKLIGVYERLVNGKAIATRRGHQNVRTEPRRNTFILAPGYPSKETVERFTRLYAGSQFTIVDFSPCRERPAAKESWNYVPVRNVFDLLRAIWVTCFRFPARCVTVYERPNFLQFIVYDVMSLIAGARSRIVHFPTLEVSYPIFANIFLQKYLNRVETKIHFLRQFIRILFTRRSKPAGQQ